MSCTHEPGWFQDQQQTIAQEDDWVDLTDYLDPLLRCVVCLGTMRQSAAQRGCVCPACFQHICEHPDEQFISAVERRCLRCSHVRIVKLPEPPVLMPEVVVGRPEEPIDLAPPARTAAVLLVKAHRALVRFLSADWLRQVAG